MKLKLQWERPIKLVDASRENMIYRFDYDRVPNSPGIYVFGRKFGRQFEALYVGKASRLRSRTKGQVNNLRLMQHVKQAKNGNRILLTARFMAGPGQRAEKCISILERALIRYFLAEGHDLVNKQGIKLRRHEIASVGSKHIVPKVMFVDRSKGE